MISINIQFPKRKEHLIRISLLFEVDSEETLFELPRWRPGRYEAANYVKNILNVNAYDADNNQLSTERHEHNSWKVATHNTQSVRFTYDYYAHAMDAGNSWVDNDLIYINFINCIFFMQSLIDEQIELELDIPESYSIACGLGASNRLTVENYYRLVDSPLLASEDLFHLQYQVQDTPFHLWFTDRIPVADDQIIDDFKKFSEVQIKLFDGEFPENDYHFLFLILPYKHYHGVEHANSTVICLGPKEEIIKEKLYTEFLGVSSHELFHAWNIIKIRPKELSPYHFGNQVNFPTGFVAEGFTTYYGDLMLKRGHVFNLEEYFNELNRILDRHLWNFGRKNESVVSSSLGLWADGYQLGSPNKKSSIYVEGAMVALTLDLTLRKHSNGKKSLDDVMRILWERYGEPSSGYTYKDILNVVNEVGQKDEAEFFEHYVKGTGDIINLVDELLNHVGLVRNTVPNKNQFTSDTGIRYVERNNRNEIIQIHPQSSFNGVLEPGDILLKINDISFPSALSFSTGYNTVKLLRNSIEMDLKIEFYKDEITYFDHSQVGLKETATSQEIALRTKWLA